MTPLHAAAVVPVDAVRGAGETALFVACWEGSLQTVRLLLATDASVNLKSTAGESLLYAAATTGHVEVVQLLLEAGARGDAAVPQPLCMQQPSTATRKW